jgi:hypothetical protein
VLDERDHEMRRTLGALFAAGVLVTILAGTVSAAPKPKNAPATSLVASACVDSANKMVFRVDWTNEAIDQTQNLTVVWTLQRAGHHTATVSDVFSPDFDATSWAVTTSDAIVGHKPAIDWNRWRTISATTSGAFNATANAIDRPGGGWAPCLS